MSLMASKRKRDDDFEYAPSSAKISKSDDSSSMSRSGRARKKPARFLDQEEGDESPTEGQEMDIKPMEIQTMKSSPSLLGATPQIINSTPQLIMATPQIISANPQLLNAAQLISVAPQTISSAPQLVSSVSQLISSVPQLINTSPQLIVSAPNLISGAPQMIVSAETVMQSKMEQLDTPKLSRVRKKSAKVIEMEEFEKAEKVKSTKKIPKVASPESGMASVTPTTGGIQPQILQAANIQLNLMNALNTSTPSDVQSSLLAHLRKNPQLVRVVDDQKLAPIKSESMLVSGPFVSPGEAVMEDQLSSVKDEPIDTVDPNILLPQSAPGSALLTHLTKMAQQEGSITPTKPPVKKKTPKMKVKEEPSASMASESQSKSVIKMLLNKPAQFSEPVISTQTLSQINSPEKNVKKAVKLKLSSETSLGPHMGPGGDASYGHVAPSAITGTLDTTKPSTSGVGSEKKKIKKTKRKQSVSILDEDDEDDDEYDEDDDEDDDMIEDDLEDNEDDLDWEFETQDGNLIIADEAPKKTTKKTPPSKKKTKKEDNQPSGGTGKEKKGQKVKKRKRLTAYTMWCNSVRYKVLNENPGIDFAQLSRRLGEIWQSVPAKDKMAWKRKAKREARKLQGKGQLITTGKGGGTSQTQTSASTASQLSISSSTPPPIYHPPIRHHSTKHHSSNNSATVSAMKQQEDLSGSPSKILGIEPIDTAAHLKLVGDSLSIIGIRLQEHRGLIAVQGSLSVLLDSLLCAVGPLMCLTTQVPELNGCSAQTHTSVLDNIAYIMPGL